MLELKLDGPFKRDLKRIGKRGWNREKLDAIVDSIQKNEGLPPNARPHKLSGDWRGYWECHIGSDWLLIYKTTDSELRLARTGTHAELFD